MDDDLQRARRAIRDAVAVEEETHVETLLADLALDAATRAHISTRAARVAGELRAAGKSSLLERFLAEYGIGDHEGVALMCLAEAFLRTPDTATLDALITDKIGTGDWARHVGRASSALVNASTWALLLTGRTLRADAPANHDLGTLMRNLLQRLGEPLARGAVSEALKILARQFVLGRNISEAMQQAAAGAADYLYSYDMLGEAARTDADARRYFLAYAQAIAAIVRGATAADPHANAGISVKLSALHPRYEALQHERVMHELVPRVVALAEHARAGNIGMSIDAEEAERLDLSLSVIEAVLATPDLADWSGFGIAVQAYAKTAPAVIAWLHALCRKLNRRIAVRLVKGAYWDSEIKRAQLLGLPGYPVLTRKSSTDVSYLHCAQQLFACAPHLYPQFATHNAHTVCAINAMAPAGAAYEFQRLLGMGEALHERLRAEDGRPRRIYAPVGVHRDLLAYLVRRLLENGANSSFVHQLTDAAVPVDVLVADPVAVSRRVRPLAHPAIALPPQLFGAERRNSRGWDLGEPHTLAALDAAMQPFRHCCWHAAASVDGAHQPPRVLYNPANNDDRVGTVCAASASQVDAALSLACAAFPRWRARPVAERAALLERAADLYENHLAELLALAAREAGKTRRDALAEVREAVDFLRYYAAHARRVLTSAERSPCGPFACISPWNFPLAIFTGQLAAALVAGNPVLAKPAEQTPLMAARAVALLHEAGVPRDVLLLLPGDGESVGAALSGDPRIAGVCFTGSLATACAIDRTLATVGNPDAVLIAETGGINAMIVDSTALAEQVVRDVMASAFRSSGQRCSALRVLFVQADVAPAILRMLEGAARELSIGDPWLPATDIGPLIDADAAHDVLAHGAALAQDGRRLFQVPLPAVCTNGSFAAPAAFRLDRFSDLAREVFGPLLHVRVFQEHELEGLIAEIDAGGYGLTFALHSRIESRIERLCAAARSGNIYINRDQIGAVVGSQPFGGVGLSGTGPKAGGPHYLTRFTKRHATPHIAGNLPAPLAALQAALPAPLRVWSDAALADAATVSFTAQGLPGVTGERNTYVLRPRGIALCLGPTPQQLTAQTVRALATGNRVVLARNHSEPTADQLVQAANAAGLPSVRLLDDEPHTWLATAPVDMVLFDGPRDELRALRRLLAARPGARIPVLAAHDDSLRLCVEQVVSEDTTAAGGNASLLALSH